MAELSHVERLVEDGARVTDDDFWKSELSDAAEAALIERMVANGWTIGRTEDYPRQNEFWPPDNEESS